MQNCHFEGEFVTQTVRKMYGLNLYRVFFSDQDTQNALQHDLCPGGDPDLNDLFGS